MKRLAFLIFILLLVACVPTTGAPTAPYGSAEYAAQATQGARAAEDARATYAAAAAQETAVSAIPTITAAAATQQAAAQMQATAVAVTATTESLQFRATEQAMAFAEGNATATAGAQQTRDALSLQATSAAVSLNASVQATAEAQRAFNVQMVQQDTAQLLANQRAKEAFWNTWRPVIVGVLLTVVVALAGFGAVLMWRNRRPVMQVMLTTPEGIHRSIPLIRDGNGFRVIPGSLPRDTPPLALPEPQEPSAAPVPLPALDIGHVLIVGETGGGKSTTMQALLQHRPQAIVLDPHAGPQDWPGKQVLGAGRNFAQIAEFMEWMIDELNRRAEQRANGVQSFPPITVASDEMPAIASELNKDGNNTYDNWQKWMREGRKFGLYIIVSTQSTRVKTLGIEGEGDVLKNFIGIVYLGEAATETYPDLALPMEWPAILKTKRGARPVIIPHEPGAGVPSPTAVPAPPPQINLPPLINQAERDGRKLNGHMRDFKSNNDVGMFLGDFSEQPSGQFLQERVYPALEWRAAELQCPDAARLLSRRKV